MDTFMDKFAQRKKAQGMIDANAAADAAKMDKLKRQVNEYELLLQEMRKVNLKTAENAGQMNRAIQIGIEKLEAFQTDNAAQNEREKILLEMKRQLETLLTEIKKGNEAFSLESKGQLETLLTEMKRENEAFSLETRQRQETFSGEMKNRQEVLLSAIRNQPEILSEEIKKQLETFLPELKKQLEESSRQSEDFFHKESVKVYRNVQAAMTEELGRQTEGLNKKTEELGGQMEALAALQKEAGKRQKAVLPLSIIILLLLLADIAVHLLNFKLF